MTDWKPIDTATKDRTRYVLLWCPWTDPIGGAIFLAVWGYPDDAGDPCWMDPYSYEPIGEATHWMWLPDPPPATYGENGDGK